MIAFKISRPGLNGWLFAGVTPREIADTIANLIDAEDIKSIDDFEPLVIEAYVTTQAAIDSLPEFDGW